MSELRKKLVASKLEEICYNLANYFNYLIIPRKGFFIVGDATNGINIEPVIDYTHIVYLLNEIYPCGDFNYRVVSNVPLQPVIEGDKRLSVVPKKARDKIRGFIRGYVDPDVLPHIEDPVFRESLELRPFDRLKINDEVINKIYAYYLAYDASLPKSDKDIKTLQLALLNKRSPVSYGLNSDVENTALQSMIFIITALVDSLDIKTVGRNEVQTAYEILIPHDLQQEYSLIPQDDETIRKILSDAFTSKNLLINNEGIQLLTDYIDKVDKLKEKVFSNSKPDPMDSDTRVLNRLLGFSSYI